MDDISKKFRNAKLYKLEDVIVCLAYIEHLQSILKKFDGVVMLTDNLLVQYFQDDIKSLIYVKLDEKDRDLNDW